jgi:hypothetical protein
VLPKGRIKGGMTISIDYNYVPFSPHQSPYCPSDPETYELLSSVLENVVRIYHPRFIHIGHDEVIRRNTDRRCLQRGLSKTELAAEDLNWWYKKLKALDPNITIMVWDDMLRQSDEKGELISLIPKDIVICPWVYKVSEDDQREIVERLDWFLGKWHRPTIGTASGYFPLNAVMWSEALRKHADMTENLGMMFSHWGEHMWLWSSLPFTADCMWSASRPDGRHLRTLIDCDESLRAFDLRAPLEFSLQKEELAARINAGENRLDELKDAMLKVENRLLVERMPGFGGTDNPIHEAIVGQGRRIIKCYEAMILARRLQVSASPDSVRRYFYLLNELMPERASEWTEAMSRFVDGGPLPDPKAVFGVDLSPATANRADSEAQ